MTEVREIVMREIRPFWGRVTVIESPLDEAQRESGLILPITGIELKRGIVLSIDHVWDEHLPGYPVGETLPEGTPVYYRAGIKIGDVVVVDLNDVLAYECPTEGDT
jgi:hypothetical protein